MSKVKCMRCEYCEPYPDASVDKRDRGSRLNTAPTAARGW